MKNKNNGIIVMFMALMMVLMMSSAVFATSWTYQDRISVQTGEPVYIVWDASPATTGTLTAVNSSYYPSTFVLWVGDGSAPTVSNGSATFLYETQTTLDDNSVVTNKAYQITLTAAGTIKVTLDSTTEYTITNSAPQGTAPSATLPTAVTEYLPIGQFATGSGWGSIFTNGTNLTGTTKKFLSGYCSTGVSLGAAGGDVTMTFSATNASSHPYGIDFIVYGNAFTGNPEAGAVKVYGFTSPTDTTGEWYDLAGSLYYDTVVTDPSTNAMSASSTISKHTKDVTWTLSGTDIKYDVTAHGTTGSPSTTFILNRSAWWPFYTSKGYDTINGMTANTAFSSDHSSVTSDRNTIVYKDICLIKDTDTTNDYQFGYFDVHKNGSNYGTAVNPYTIADDGFGGDGFDLSWAVDSTGKPVSLDHITKIRLYTAAALTSNGTAFTTPSIFGETSAEVCGVYGVNGSGTSNIKVVQVAYDNDPNNYLYPSNLGYETIQMSSGTITLTFTSSATNLLVNGKSISSGSSITFSVGSGETKYVQIISQTGDSSPLVTAIKLVRANS